VAIGSYTLFQYAVSMLTVLYHYVSYGRNREKNNGSEDDLKVQCSLYRSNAIPETATDFYFESPLTGGRHSYQCIEYSITS
jgi:hypothetical protein